MYFNQIIILFCLFTTTIWGQECDEGYVWIDEIPESCESDVNCFYQSDLEVFQILADNNNETIDMEMDANGNGTIEPLEIGEQQWINGRILTLNCNFCGLSSEIPADIEQLTSLTELNLAYNELTGSLPESLPTLINLEILNLSYNSLHGELPAGIGNLTQLTYLNFAYNELNGDIPDSITQLDNLNNLLLSSNQFEGTLPESICILDLNWNNSYYFDIYNNNICPTYPDCLTEAEIGSQYCSSCPNQFTGINGYCYLLTDYYIVQDIINQSNLSLNTEMDINQNGQIEPLELGVQGWFNGRLEVLDCHWYSDEWDVCQLSGEIPASIGNLAELKYLFLGNNQLTGTIPETIGNLTNLNWLSLFSNQLTGEIPETIGNLSNLEWLILHNNQLSGYIPESICNLNMDFSDYQFDITGNYLCPPYPECVAEYLSVQDTSGCTLFIMDENVPLAYNLYPSFPNPFNPETKISFSLPEKSFISLEIFDLKGNKISTLVNQYMNAGLQQINWNANHLSSGTYFIRINATSNTNINPIKKDFSLAQQITLLK